MKHVTLSSMEVKNRTMKKRNFFAFFAAFSVVGIAASLIASFRTADKPAVKAEAYSDTDFAAETELTNGEELSVDISNYSVSDYGASLELKFATGSKSLSNDVEKYYVIGSTDEFVNDVEEFNNLEEQERDAIRQEVAEGLRDTILYEAELYRVKYDIVDVYIPRTASRGVYGYDDVYRGTILEISDFVLPFSTIKNIGSDEINFIIGYFADEAHPLPLIIEYQIEGETTKRYKELAKTSTTLKYDAVGAGVTAYVQKISVNIDIEKGKNIDPHSIKVHNVYKAIKHVEEVAYFTPETDLSGNPIAHFIVPAVSYSRINNLNDFISIQFKSVSTFAGYTVINSVVNVVNEGEIYKQIKPGQYELFKEQLENGTGRYRFRFTSLKNSAKYRFEYNNQTVYKRVDTPTGHYIFDGYYNNNISFAIQDSMLGDASFNGKNLQAFGITDMYISVDIVVGTSIYSSTRFEINFGTIYFMTPHDTIKVFDANLFMILTVLIYSVLAIGVGAFLFFYYKKKYRNDEFRRLKPKQFIKKGLIYWLTSTAIVIAIESIIFRFTVLKNAIVVFNPIDVLIVIFGIATIIIIGYYVKTITSAYKANQQRKRAIKLGMVNETADDGTK